MAKTSKGGKNIARNAQTEHAVQDRLVNIYEILVGCAIAACIAAIGLDHENTSLWEGLWLHADQILNEKTFGILAAVFILIMIGQWVIVYSKRQQLKYIKARRRNHETNEFLTLISHSIRTPLNGILGLNTIIGHKTKDADVANYVTQIQRAGDSLLSNLDEILDFSKIEQDSIEIVEDTYDISYLVCDCYQMMKERAAQKQLAFEVSVDSTMPRMMYGDVVRIRQVILNILSNAVKYTKEGSVHFSLGYDRLDNQQIHLNIVVTDTGIGISDEALPHVFDAYKRIDVYKIRNVEGTGLGMAISKELVERMGGRIMVSSKEGQGTTFRVRIPQKIMVNQPVGHVDLDSKTFLYQQNSWFYAPGVRVLIVDDVEMNLKVLAGMLEPSGIWVEEARSGEECLEMTTKESYDVILMDDRMPGMRGVTCFERIRNQQGGRNTNTPVMMVTANAGRGVGDAYLRMGFAAYVPKPIREEELIHKLRPLLKGKFLDK